MGRTRFVDLRFDGGLNEYAEATQVPETFGVVIQNWVPEPSGGLRVPRAWQAAPTAGLSGTKTVRGIGFHAPVAGGGRFVVGHATGSSSMKLISIPKVIIGQTWSTIETVTVTPTTRPLAMASGAGHILYATPEFPSNLIRRWDGTTVSDAGTDQIAGRALSYHNNRFFSGGSTGQPTYLYWTELGTSDNWAIATNFQPIGQDDGEPIEALASWDRGLLIGKENSVHYLTGFGPDTFAFHELDGGGCAPGPTLVSTPSGVVAIGRRRVWFFAGGGFEPISQPIENTYGMTGQYMSGAYIDGEVYVNDEGSGTTWVYNLATQAWHTETFDLIAEGPGYVAVEDEVLLAGTRVATTNSLLLYRYMPGSVRGRIPGSGQTFRAMTGQMWSGGPVGPWTPLHIHIQMRQRGGTSADEPLIVKQYVDGALSRTETVALHDSPGVYRERVDVGLTGYSHQFEFLHPVSILSDATVDLERVTLEVQDEPAR